MDLSRYSDPVERSIVNEIVQWSKVALEKPNPSFNNLPACPYSKKALADNKISVVFKYEASYRAVYTAIDEYDDTFDLCIVIDLKNTKNSDEFHEYLDHLNTVIAAGTFVDRDKWVMGFHPDDEESEFVQDIDFEPSTGVEYSMIFVQRLSKLQEAADKLDKKCYYDGYDEESNWQEIYARRTELHRRLKNGDET